MLMKQISLKKLDYYFYNRSNHIPNIPFLTYPGAIDCLKDLSELKCDSGLYFQIFFWLSQICHHLQTLKISLKSVISYGLMNLILVQQNLKYLDLYNYSNCKDLSMILDSLIKLVNTLIKLKLHGIGSYESLSFLTRFTNLQKLVFF